MSKPALPPGSGAVRIRRPYCLRCYAAMEPYQGSRSECRRCGFLNLKLDQGLFWTKERRMRDLEELAKFGIVFFLLGIVGLMLFALGRGTGFGTGQGWAIGFPILVGVVFWETAEKITRHKPYFRAAIVWRIVFIVLGPPMLLVGLAVGPGIAQIVLCGMAAFMLAGVVFGGRWSRAAERWRDRRILAGQSTQS